MLLIFIIIVLIMLLVITDSKFSNNGFADISESYTQPVIYDNLVTPEEAEYIINTAKDSFKESKIIGGFDESIRKSKTSWLYRNDPVINNIITRICNLTGSSIKNTEPLQVVQYEPGGFYNDHHDSCCDNNDKCKEFVQNGGQRVLTVLIYLNDDFTGGSTRFSTIGRDYKPAKYGGLVFRPLADNSNKCHPLGLHKGTPVESGVKYVCNLWIRESEYK